MLIWYLASLLLFSDVEEIKLETSSSNYWSDEDEKSPWVVATAETVRALSAKNSD